MGVPWQVMKSSGDVRGGLKDTALGTCESGAKTTKVSEKKPSHGSKTTKVSEKNPSRAAKTSK